MDISVRYRFLQHSEELEATFDGLRVAFDRACEDLVAESAAPLCIAAHTGEVLFTLGDLCDMSADWLAWKEGQREHPLGPQED